MLSVIKTIRQLCSAKDNEMQRQLIDLKIVDLLLEVIRSNNEEDSHISFYAKLALLQLCKITELHLHIEDKVFIE
jgi:TorA maturation chaperone TorD